MHSKTKTPSRLDQHVTSSLYKARYNSCDCPCSGQAPYSFPVLRPESAFPVCVAGSWNPHPRCAQAIETAKLRVKRFGQGCRLDLTPRTTSPRALLSGRRPYPGSTQTGSGSVWSDNCPPVFMQTQSTPNQRLSDPGVVLGIWGLPECPYERATRHAHCRSLPGRVLTPNAQLVTPFTNTIPPTPLAGCH